MKLADTSICTGCGACAKACPKQAIDFRDDQEGFPTPYIQSDQCIECGACNKICPALHMPETHPIQAAYAAQILDKDALKDSTSGGVFTALSREIFRRNGVVYGCIWDEAYNAIVRKAENEEEMKSMRGSKYVWSWAADTFPEIKKYLEEDRIVMFTGLPCQVAGLKNYLRKGYGNLYLVDFFCGGSPSPYAFHEYLKTITKDIPMGQLNLKLRDKEKYGVGVHISYETKQGRVHQSYIRNPYYFSFYTKVFHRQSCYHCQYRYEKRVEDITIGDYWGVEKFHFEFNVRAGVSAVLINSDKGAELIDAVRQEIQLSETAVTNIAVGNNLTLGDKQVEFHSPQFRDAFFHTLKTKGWTAAERKYLYNKTRLKLWIKMKVPDKYIPMLKKITGRQ